jgi:hypothetical protein
MSSASARLTIALMMAMLRLPGSVMPRMKLWSILILSNGALRS